MAIENELDKALQELSKQNEKYTKSLIDFIKSSRDILETDNSERLLAGILKAMKNSDEGKKTKPSKNQIDPTVQCCVIDLILRILNVVFGDIKLLGKNLPWPYGATNFLLLEKSRRLQIPFADVKAASVTQIWIVYFSVLVYFFRTDRIDDLRRFLNQFSKYQKLIKDNQDLRKDVEETLFAITVTLWGAYEVVNDGQEIKLQITDATTKPSFLPNVIAFDKSLYRVIPNLQMKLLKGLAGSEKNIIKKFIETVSEKRINDLPPEAIDIVAELINSFYRLLKKDLGSYASLVVTNLYEDFSWVANSMGLDLLEEVSKFLQEKPSLTKFITIFQDKTLTDMEPEAVITFCKSHPEYANSLYVVFNLKQQLSNGGYNFLLGFLENLSADPEFEEVKNIFLDENGNFYLLWPLLGKNKKYLAAFKKIVRIIVIALANFIVIVSRLFTTPTVSLQNFLGMLLQPFLNVTYAMIFATAFQYVVSPIFKTTENYITVRHAVVTSGIGLWAFWAPSQGDVKSKNLNKFIESKLEDKANIFKIFLSADLWISQMGCFKKPQDAFAQLWNIGIDLISGTNSEIKDILQSAKIESSKTIENFDLDGVFLGFELKKYLESVISAANELRNQNLAAFLVFPNIKRKVVEKFRDRLYNFDIEKINALQPVKEYTQNLSNEILLIIKKYSGVTQAYHIEEYVSKNEDIIAEVIVDVLYYHLSGIFINAEIQKFKGRFKKEDVELAKKIFNVNRVVDHIDKVFSLSSEFKKAMEDIGLVPTYKETVLHIASLISSNNIQKIKEELPSWLGSSNARQIGTAAFFEVWELMDSFLPEPAVRQNAFYTKDSCYCYRKDKTDGFGELLKGVNDIAAFISYIPEALRDGVFQALELAFQWLTTIQSKTQIFTKWNDLESVNNIFDWAKKIADFIDASIDVIQAILNPKAIAIVGMLLHSMFLTTMRAIEGCLVKKG